MMPQRRNERGQSICELDTRERQAFILGKCEHYANFLPLSLISLNPPLSLSHFKVQNYALVNLLQMCCSAKEPGVSFSPRGQLDH